MLLTFLLKSSNDYKMYTEEAVELESIIKPMIALDENQIGIYEYVDLSEKSYAYIFRAKVLISEPFNEGDYLTLFDSLSDYYYEHIDDTEYCD